MYGRSPMNPDEVVEMADREAEKRRYARINWNAHLVPVVREAVADFGSASGANGQPLPQLALRSHAIARGEIVGAASAAAGDALTVQFGVCPGGIDSPAPSGYSRPLIAPGKPALVFAQAPTGAVAVFLYPAGTPAAGPYRIGEYQDPAELTRSRVRRLLRSLCDMPGKESLRPHKVVAMAEREAEKRRYARINWNAHLVPVAREAVADFGGSSAAKDHPLPQLALLSDAIDHGEIVGDASVEAGDALTVQFGVRPGGIDSPAPPGYSRPLIAPGKPALVFAQDASGAVAVFLYPAGPSAEKSQRIGEYRDPADLTRSRVRRLLRSLLDMHGDDFARPAVVAI